MLRQISETLMSLSHRCRSFSQNNHSCYYGMLMSLLENLKI